ncbi:uncharacterized protein BDZ99DRAFT_391355 [Mytilinidion resinicola]|uniref:Uncharacterized protein n=1 Tax=Mytilinidion resinicola TaxID=574789 RepID=A0A6A6YGQ4_9PEZI|nr:uncharacterized protein BDZ99DRAFT_391355 [Mytilinidion resinicola]KAF2807920.1 hypothetical protein BDZ99DRAFT_391355 [Mytilinidion resinicola]
MASQIHSRNVSEESNGSASSYQDVLEHLLQYPGNYEIPLRTMYTINSAGRPQPAARSRAQTPTTSKGEDRSPISEGEYPNHEFTASLMNQISKLPSQPCSLPPTFIVSFVSKCFPPFLGEAEFSQSLAALDYIRDLETRRHKEYAAALRRLTVLPNTVGTEADDFSERLPGVGRWVANAEAKNNKADMYYAQLWIGLRRWIMINEMSADPFSKHNSVAMLNTLYPPPHPGLNPQLVKGLTPESYKQQRDGFFKYITAVGKRGSSSLQNLRDQGKLDGEEDGYHQVAISVDKYLGVAKQIIDDCCNVLSIEQLDPVQEAPNRKGKKTDSGVSFGSSRRPSTSAGKETPLAIASAATPHKSSQKGLTTLEKISREFKRIRVKTRPDVEEIVKPQKVSPLFDITDNDNRKPKPKIKKMKSMGSLQTLKKNNMSATSLIGRRKASATEDFDEEEMRRARMHYNARSKTLRG